MKIADLGLSRIFLNDRDLPKTQKDQERNVGETGRQECASSEKGLQRRIRQRQYSHQVATRWYRYANFHNILYYSVLDIR